MLELAGSSPEAQRPRWLSALLDALGRLEAGQASPSPSFEKRLRPTLLLAAWLMLAIGLPCALYFWLEGMQGPSAINVLVSLAALAGLGLVRQSLFRSASWLLIISGLLTVSAHALITDVPTPAVPRGVHLLLLPLAVVAVFLLQNERRGVRAVLPVLTLAVFAVFVSTSSTFGFTPIMSDLHRQIGLPLTAISAVAIIYATLRVNLNEVRERTALERDFARAIATSGLEVYLQAQCSSEGRIIGAEALMRWHHPKRGYISPAEFIPMAEHSGLIVPAGEFIMREVCAALSRWRDDPVLGQIAVSVNVSAAQLFSPALSTQLVEIVPRGLGQSGRLKFELTESIFVHDFAAVQALLERIRAEGVRISLDDFGTGFSSLSYLKKLPLDQIKVDQSFVRDMPEDARTSKIALTIIQLGGDLGLEVVAEGVEKLEQVLALKAMGCEIFQGFLFSRPIPISEFEKLATEVHAGRVSLLGSAAISRMAA